MITPEERIVAIETRLDTVIQDVKESRVNIHAIRNQTNDITSKFYERIANLEIKVESMKMGTGIHGIKWWVSLIVPAMSLVISLIVLGVLLKK